MYDFTSAQFIKDRHGRDARAVDMIPIPGATVNEGWDRIPMWVADMNFPTCPTIPEAIIERAKHPAYGYFAVPDAYYNAITNWHKTRYGIDFMKKENILYENGVLGAVVSALQLYTDPGEGVLLHSPCYIGFTGCITNNGRKLVLSDLVQDEKGTWRMDFDDMDKKIKANKIHFVVFCSPHNPCGRVWEKWEIEKAMEIYKANDCVVVSDEIWADFTLGGRKHTPTQSVSEDARNRTIAIYAPSKTFNLAGLIGSYSVTYNKAMLDRMVKHESLSHYNTPNVLSVHALIGAYRPEGLQWVSELMETLTTNIEYGYNFIKDHFKGVNLGKPEGTYMLYLDCEAWVKEHNMTMEQLLFAGVAVGVIWQDGRPFNRPYAIRMNLAVPTSVVKDAFDRLDKYVFNAK